MSEEESSLDPPSIMELAGAWADPIVSEILKLETHAQVRIFDKLCATSPSMAKLLLSKSGGRWMGNSDRLTWLLDHRPFFFSTHPVRSLTLFDPRAFEDSSRRSSLKLDRPSSSQIEKLRSLSASHPHLKSSLQSLDFYTFSPDSAFESLRPLTEFLHLFPSIRSASISSTSKEITWTLEDPLSFLSSLTHLELQGSFQALPSEAHSCLSHLKSLRSLETRFFAHSESFFHHCSPAFRSFLTSLSIPANQALIHDFLPKFSNLRTLSIGRMSSASFCPASNYFIDGSTLINFAAVLPSLKSLTFNQPIAIESPSVLQAFSLLEELRFAEPAVSLPDVFPLKFIDLKFEDFHYLSNLKSLIIEDQVAFDGCSFGFLFLQLCTSLTKLVIASAIEESSQPFKPFDFSHLSTLSNLAHLVLLEGPPSSHYRSFSHSSLSHLSSSLTLLSFRSSLQVEFEQLLETIPRLTNLRSLHLEAKLPWLSPDSPFGSLVSPLSKLTNFDLFLRPVKISPGPPLPFPPSLFQALPSLRHLRSLHLIFSGTQLDSSSGPLLLESLLSLPEISIVQLISGLSNFVALKPDGSDSSGAIHREMLAAISEALAREKPFALCFVENYTI